MNTATPYGGADASGERTNQAKADPSGDRDTNTNAGPMSGSTSTTGGTTTAPTGGSSTAPTGGQVPQDQTVDKSQVPKDTKKEIGMEADLPKVMDIINTMDIFRYWKGKRPRRSLYHECR